MHHDIIAIGASAGGVETLKQLIAGLPADLPASVFITLHISPVATSALPIILQRASKIRVKHPVEGERIRHGVAYVAPPDHHLILRGNTVHLSRAPKENGTRPAIDPMFRSAARAFHGRVIGVVLSGTLDDGSNGLEVIKARGGIAVAQDPDTALFGDMPRNAIARGVDHIAPLDDIPELLIRLVQQPCANIGEAEMDDENETPAFDTLNTRENKTGIPTDFTCPDCGGVLHRIDNEKGNLHFRCHVGHAWASESLQSAQVERVEESLWAALRILQENDKLVRKLHEDAVTKNLEDLAQHYHERLRDIDYHKKAIRSLLVEENE